MPGSKCGDPGGSVSIRGRNKKLIVAFRFLRGNQAAWKCDDCRRSGLEQKRNCGWLNERQRQDTVVWASKGVAINECPRTYVRGESIALVERYVAWRLGGSAVDMNMRAKDVDAFQILTQESEPEVNDD